MGVIKKQIAGYFKQMGRDIDKANIMALNKAGVTAFNRTIRLLTETYNIKLKVLKEYFRVVKGNKNKPYVTIIANKKPLGFFRNSGAEKLFTVSSQQKKGVKATVKKGDRKLYEGAFIVKTKSGHVNIFKRQGKDKLPIQELYAMDPGKLFADEVAQAQLEKEFTDRFQTEFTQAYNYVRK